MPFENGRRVRGYLRKRKHKFRKKTQWRVVATIRYSFGYYVDKPFKQFYRSGRRKGCKKQTYKRLRQIHEDNLPRVPSGYRKTFDYWWELN